MGCFSACVMNFISHDVVCSFYPFSTFCDHRLIIWGIKSAEECRAAEKYEKRGWEVDHFLQINDMMALPSELGGMKKRRVGDPLCWSFRLDDGKSGKEQMLEVGAYSWMIEYSRITVEDVEIAFRGQMVVND